ncbi:MAG TPA: hypothetical protein VH583_07595 [Vicinamibacterales bacterium]|jgi:YHS domain-containing protein
MIRIALLLILFIVIARVFWRFVDNVIEAAGGVPSSRGVPPRRAQSMVRDPVCGTFLLPERAIVLAESTGAVYFCSAACRDEYRARRTSGGRPAAASGGRS